MEIQGLQALYAGHKSVKALAKALQDGSVRTIFAEGLCASAAPLLFSSVAAACPQVMACPYVFVLDDAEEAGYFYHDLTQILGEQEVFYFPSSFRRAVKFGQRDAANEILRTEVISRLSAGHSPLFVVTYPEAVMEKVVSRQKLDEQTLRLYAGERVDITFVEETLRAFGFRRVDYVYEPGQFAVRGSILDVFSFSSEWPYRVDFFGDEVDSIRTFEVQTQLSRDKQEEIVIVPELAGYVQGKVPFTDFLPPETVLVMKDLFFLRDVADRVYADGFSAQALMDEQARTEMEEAERHEKLRADLMLVDGSALMKGMLDFRRVEVGNKPSATPQATVRFHLTAQPIFHKNFELVTRTFHEYLEKGYTLYILADSAKQTDRLASIFTEQASGIDFTPVNRTLHAGFADDDLKACFFTDHQIFDRFHKYNLRSDKARSGKVALSLKELQEFNIGDYVVHVDHGVGKFGGLVRIPNGDTMQEVIKIIYQNDDVVFVSIHSLHKVSKYRGKEGEPPRLNKLGTGAWERLKERTKTKIKDIARDLIKLYSLRRQEKGFAFSPDSFMQHELEASFLYEDTPDQLKATQAVKADMERDRPMDRLVCGDVGFGKTEVAIRAAFKACADNKQVAVLVPTTVLAYQHFQTFSSRLKGMPVRVDYLSRARSAAKTKEILRDLADGKINIIVGTHKLIGKSVKFKDLGLLIIDEEQKFGVATKEKLRQMKVNVDTLTLTATPIPRTLQFSLMGARDLSVIQTPPPNRYPIVTELHRFDEQLIKEVILYEMARNGQVFFIHNRVETIRDIQGMLQRIVPQVKTCVAHGQMEGEELEKVMHDFVRGDYDVLIATTIIESGLDIPNANTMIINQAQNYGLSDLHQLRGRVGRSNKKAFCYLLTPPLDTVNSDARRRLKAIEDFSGLGSGFNIAMQDLDIRGAGNILGAEQSGFIAEIGYETYQRILNEALLELREEEFPGMETPPTEQKQAYVADCVIESDFEVLIPDTYVENISERIRLYRELDNIPDEAGLEKFGQELKDRFGEIPAQVTGLMEIVRMRRRCMDLGIERLLVKNGKMIMYFVGEQTSPFYQSALFAAILRFVQLQILPCRFSEKNNKLSLVFTEITNIMKMSRYVREMWEKTEAGNR